jgi:hypothetical protein
LDWEFPVSFRDWQFLVSFSRIFFFFLISKWAPKFVKLEVYDL